MKFMQTLLNLPNNILASLILTLGCLAFGTFLMVVYFNKQQRNGIRNKLYRGMLMAVTFELVTELVNTFCIAYGITDIFYRIVYVIHWFSFVVWFGLYYLHSYCYLHDITAISFKDLILKNKKALAMTIFVGVGLIGYLFMPVSKMTIDTIDYIAGPAEYYILTMLSIIGACILSETYFMSKNAPKRRKVAISLVFFVLIVVLGLQMMYEDICLYVLGTSLHVFFLYFIIENPDIQMTNEIEALKADVDRSNRAKTDFLSNMSHEIRTPMNAIIGFSDSLLNSQTFDPVTAKTDIQSIATAGNNLIDIINNILDISKIESGKELLECREYSLVDVVMELTSIIESRLGSSPIKLIVELDEKTPSKLYGDSTKIYQVLLNILSNSVKYTEVGKIKLTIVPEFPSEQPDMVIFHYKIADTGYGIKKEDYDKLFSKFSRLDTAVSNEIEGTGLGLVITKRYVDLMDGKIWFESEYEVGTTFYIDLSQKIVDKNPIGNINKKQTDSAEREYLDCSKYTALVVDDNKLNIKVADRILKKYNFTIDTSSGGKDCVYKVKTGKHYDIIFLDHMMPEMDGIETLHIIKKLEGYDIPPIIALTANAITGMKEMYLREGFDSYLSKPINIAELDKVIHKYFESMPVSKQDSSNSIASINIVNNEAVSGIPSVAAPVAALSQQPAPVSPVPVNTPTVTSSTASVIPTTIAVTPAPVVEPTVVVTSVAETPVVSQTPVVPVASVQEVKPIVPESIVTAPVIPTKTDVNVNSGIVEEKLPNENQNNV